jgi:type IV pilus assembly protein PilW
MLALALGVVVTLGIVQLFVGNSQTYTLMNGQARMQENGRVALDLITASVRSTGYLGCAPEQPNIVKNLRGNWNLLFEFDVTHPVQGYRGNADGTWTPPLASLPSTVGGVTTNTYIPGNGIDTSQVARGTDVLVLREARLPGQPLLQVVQPTGDPVVRAPGGDSGIKVNDIVVLGDCEQAAIFRATAVNTAGNQATIQHAVTTTGDIYENGTQALSTIGRAYGEEAIAAPLDTVIFFIAPSTSGANNRGNVPLALWQKVGSAAPTELVEGIENLTVLFGIDTTLGDGVTNANQYVPYNAATAAQIVSVRVSVTANSVDEVTGTGGSILRRTVTETMQLRNART